MWSEVVTYSYNTEQVEMAQEYRDMERVPQAPASTVPVMVPAILRLIIPATDQLKSVRKYQMADGSGDWVMEYELGTWGAQSSLATGRTIVDVRPATL